MGNPEVVLAGIIMLFQQYPANIVSRAVSPVYGLPKTHKFMPRIAEIAQFLEHEAAPLRRQQEREERPLMLPESPIDRSKRKSYEELQELCARDGMLIGKRARHYDKASAAREFMAKNEISKEDFDAIPNAPMAHNWDKLER